MMNRKEEAAKMRNAWDPMTLRMIMVDARLQNSYPYCLINEVLYFCMTAE
jgi:hypothetical protein